MLSFNYYPKIIFHAWKYFLQTKKIECFFFFFFQDVIPLWKEVEYYKEYQMKLRAHLGDEKANAILRDALYLVSIGTNDFLENYYILPERRSEFITVQQYEDFLIGLAENFFREIYDLGARKISLTALPPMGCLPLERAINILHYHGCVEEYNNVALEFNGKMGRLVTKLNKDLPGLQLVDANAYDILLQIVTQPSRFGKYKLTMQLYSFASFVTQVNPSF